MAFTGLCASWFQSRICDRSHSFCQIPRHTMIHNCPFPFIPIHRQPSAIFFRPFLYIQPIPNPPTWLVIRQPSSYLLLCSYPSKIDIPSLIKMPLTQIQNLKQPLLLQQPPLQMRFRRVRELFPRIPTIKLHIDTSPCNPFHQNIILGCPVLLRHVLLELPYEFLSL
jgi:hypothetical protein